LKPAWGNLRKAGNVFGLLSPVDFSVISGSK